MNLHLYLHRLLFNFEFHQRQIWSYIYIYHPPTVKGVLKYSTIQCQDADSTEYEGNEHKSRKEAKTGIMKADDSLKHCQENDYMLHKSLHRLLHTCHGFTFL